MEKMMEDFLYEKKLNLHHEKISIAVSTGVDSMVLLSLLQNIFSPENIIVCHVNHQRRIESAKEEEFMRDYCKKKQLKLYVKSLDNLADSNFQEEARLARLTFFKEVMAKEKSKYLFLAHHLDDDLETFLLRFIRGSSLASYSGMKDFYYQDNIYIIRPLLKVPKKEILSFATKNKITYFEDSSNFEDTYTRNRIRHEIVPIMEKENPLIREKYLEFKEILEYASLVINNLTTEWINSFVKQTKQEFSFSRKDYFKLNEVLRREVLFTLLKPFTLSRANIEELIALIISPKASFSSKIENYVLMKSYDEISFFINEDSLDFSPVIIKGIGEYIINKDWRLVVRKKRFNSQCNFRKIWYNSNMLPLTARARQDGDKIEFDYGHKKLKKLLIDNKIAIDKRKTSIVLDKDGEVLALLPYAYSVNIAKMKNTNIIIELKENKQ